MGSVKFQNDQGRNKQVVESQQRKTSFVVQHVFKEQTIVQLERSADRKRQSVGEDRESRVYRAVESDRLLWCDELTDKETKRGMKYCYTQVIIVWLNKINAPQPEPVPFIGAQ